MPQETILQAPLGRAIGPFEFVDLHTVVFIACVTQMYPPTTNCTNIPGSPFVHCGSSVPIVFQFFSSSFRCFLPEYITPHFSGESLQAKRRCDGALPSPGLLSTASPPLPTPTNRVSNGSAGRRESNSLALNSTEGEGSLGRGSGTLFNLMARQPAGKSSSASYQ